MVYACPMLGFGYPGGGYLGMVLGTVFWLAVIVGIVWLAIKWINKEKAGNRASNPLEIVKERYAKGEISKQEYELLRNEMTEAPKAKPLSKMKKERRREK